MPLLSTIIRKAKRIAALGPQQSVHLIKNRINQTFFEKQWRVLAQQHQASHTWQFIEKKHTTSWAQFFNNNNSLHVPLTTMNSNMAIAQADIYAHNIFSLLGSQPQRFETMPWHEDFRLKQHNASADFCFDPHTFYKDIQIHSGRTSELQKDIKVPWELSRCQHLPILGIAYKANADMAYVQKFTYDITDWIEQNPYLLGPNWVCPMEVGIRSINWIITWDFFKHAPGIDATFLQAFTASLYDHAHYLEHNWEFYDGKTSNHYLSDLVGYYYLCWFFSSIPEFKNKARWCHQEILREWDKQVFEEGTDYEGSTKYHRLVTELFYHFLLMSKPLQHEMPQKYWEKFDRMLAFIDWCTPVGGELVSIGDNDSGRVTDYIKLPATKPNHHIKQYPQFGLSILKTDSLHITLRHNAYNEVQPSGHMHNDALSITLAINGIPLFIDPGSYVYTPSAPWRNTFRSVKAHNTFYIAGHEPIPFDERLFAMNIPPACPPQLKTIEGEHALYTRFGLQAHRSIAYTNNRITITDRWHTLAQYNTNNALVSCWNFTLHPTLRAEKHAKGITLWHNNDIIATITSDLEFTVETCWVSPEYGSKIKSSCLRAEKNLIIKQPQIITVTLSGEALSKN